MREAPGGYIRDLAVQWACAAVDLLLGETTLSRLPVFLSGYSSVLDHPNGAAFARAAFSLRQLGVSIASDIQLRQSVHAAVAWEEANVGGPEYIEPPYELHPDRADHSFRRRVPADDPMLLSMVAALTGGLQFRRWTIPIADPARPMAFMTGAFDGAERIIVDMADATVPPPSPTHDLTLAPRGPIIVPLAELERVAERLDALDTANPGRPPGNWASRLRESSGERKFHTLSPDRSVGVLIETEEIRLEGLKHLIGLPGTGKTTLIVLLLMWLDANGYRTTVLLPSIEASLNMLGDLRFYGADVGLLVGQSPQTRIEHARKLGERIGADDTRGFGRSAPGADLLGLNCALAAFDSDPDGVVEFPHLFPPCMQILQRGLKKDGTPKVSETKHLCPVSGWCGRMKAPRELTERRIWLGHVLSMDTRISPHFANDQLRYFEAIAMASDLVVVDEADGAQAVLDGKAIASLDLTGSVDSYEHALNRDLFMPLAVGRNDLVASNVHSYSNAAADFSKLNRGLVAHLQGLRNERSGDGDEHPLARFKDTFVTGDTVIGALFCPENLHLLPGPERLTEDRRFAAIRAFWDACVRRALFARTAVDTGVQDYEFEPARVAADIGRTEDQVADAALAVAELLRDWVAEPLPSSRDAVVAELREVVFALIPPRVDLADKTRGEFFKFLVGVTSVIFQFLALVPAQQVMVAEGIHHEPLFRQGISEDFARAVPDSLLGRLSGIRFNIEDGGPRSSVTLKYVTFRGTPRTLLYRLHELLRHDGRETGPAVLLASATSFLAESPTFHIPIGPDIVLRRAGDDAGWRDSLYEFSPVPDPRNPGRALRFSGSPLIGRDRVLRQMVDSYFSGDDPHALALAREFDQGRKTGFVVNSYEQVRKVKEHLARTRPDLARRTIAVTDRIPERNEGDWVTAAQVERIGARDDWDCIVFPMKALARGVNIVFERGPRVRDAMLGVLVFLIRPHPATESLDFVAGLAGSRTNAFDQREFDVRDTVSDMAAAWREERRDLMATTRRLLRFPMQARRLGPLGVPFSADIMVDVLQTIGRAMRNGCKARVVFADAAWAPVSASPGSRPDGPDTSMLVTMRDILAARLTDPDPVDRTIYRALYEPFFYPLERCSGVRFPNTENPFDEEGDIGA